MTLDPGRILLAGWASKLEATIRHIHSAATEPHPHGDGAALDYIAACSSVVDLDQKSIVEVKDAEIERLRGVLEFYADPNIYKPHPHGIFFDRRNELYLSARDALAASTSEPCECCGESTKDGECAPCNMAREEGEQFAAEHGLPNLTAPAGGTP
jgi:hypothetical protein